MNSDQNYQNISRIISDNFKLVEHEHNLKSESYFLRKKKTFPFSINRLLEELQLRDPYLIKQSIIGETSFNLNIEDLLATEFNLMDYSFAQMMPIKLIDFNSRDKYLIKQKLNSLFELHLKFIYNNQIKPKSLDFSKIIENFNKNDSTNLINSKYLSSLNSSNFQLPTDLLICNPLVYLNELTKLLNTIESDEYCEYLRNLYYQNLFSLEFINLKVKDRELVAFSNNKDELQIINETLETAIQSKCYHKIFKSILHTNQISNSTLNDEICLLTTNWTYSKSILESLKEEISSFVDRKMELIKLLPNSDNRQMILNLFELNDDFLLFSDLDEQKNKTKNKKTYLKQFLNYIETNEEEDQFNLIGRLINKNENIFEFYLNELNFLTIDLTRDLLIHLITNLIYNSKSSSIIDFELNQLPTFQFLMFDSKKSDNYLPTQINLNIDPNHSSNSKFMNQLKNKLQLFINQLYHRKLLKKALLSLNHEPDVEMYLRTIWTNIIKLINNLQNIDQSYLAEIFLANKRNLQNSSSFISRKYLFFIIRNLFETIYLVCSTIYDKFPIRLLNELNKNKMRLDTLIDQAFLIHLKNEQLCLLADADPSIQIEKPNLTKFLNQKITRQNLIEVLAQLISLVRFKLLQCTFYSSPLYTEFVKINEQFKNMDDYFEKQMNINLFKVLNLDKTKSGVIKDPTKVITDIIENEILMRYLTLIPKLECIEQVGEIGAQILLDLGMKKKRNENY